MKIARKRKGLSLLEIMVAVGLFSVATLMIITLLIKGFRSYNTGRAYIALQQNVRQIADLIATEVREADSGQQIRIGSCTAWNPPTNSCPGACAASSQISFHKLDPFTHCSGACTATPGGDESVTYSFSSNQVYRQPCSCSPIPITPGNVTINSVAFASTCVNNQPLIQITVAAQKQAAGFPNPLTFTLQTSVAPRFLESLQLSLR